MPALRRWPIIAALGALLIARAARATLPYRSCERCLLWLGKRIGSLRRVRAGDPRTIAGAVSIASRRLPLRPTCLDRSRAARLLLAAGGVNARLRLGARRAVGGGIEAHAWLEHDGRVLLGGGEMPGFVPFGRGRGDGA